MNKYFKDNFEIIEKVNRKPFGLCYFVRDKIKNEYMYVPVNDIELFDADLIEYFKTLHGEDSKATIDDPAHLYVVTGDGYKGLLMD